MAAKKGRRPRKPEKQAEPVAGLLPEDPALESGQRDSGQPGGGQGRVDVTGVVPEGVRVDPNLTEGHPGYQDSGDSEIIPPRDTEGSPAGKKASGRRRNR
jgi:hypothetical protein